ncbi:uncharacterized protein LOC125666477 [Ostrea edulis]|uniref:uncharacterized protein LOC125666477 n=1 Tax=Ostrea edulis TaxID=37623 RepID=UPI0024AFDA00|nr:uncharacterized protein LOC125666477 [Ostrea edulis]
MDDINDNMEIGSNRNDNAIHVKTSRKDNTAIYLLNRHDKSSYVRSTDNYVRTRGNYVRILGNYVRKPSNYVRKPGNYVRKPGKYARKPGNYVGTTDNYDRTPANYNRTPATYNRRINSYNTTTPTNDDKCFSVYHSTICLNVVKFDIFTRLRVPML